MKGDDGFIKLWDLGSGKCMMSFNASRVTSLEFSKDSNILVSGSLDGTVKIWDILSNDNEACLKTFYSKQTDVLNVSVSNRNLLYALGSSRNI